MRITKSRSLEAKKGSMMVRTGLAAVAISAFVGLAPAGVAHATEAPGGTTFPTTKADCKNGKWKDYGFKNQGQCVSWVTHKSNNGYGGGNINANANVNLNLNNSDDNVINIIIRWVFGG